MLSRIDATGVNRSARRDRIVRATQPRVRIGQLDVRRPDIEVVGMLVGASMLTLLAAVIRLA